VVELQAGLEGLDFAAGERASVGVASGVVVRYRQDRGFGPQQNFLAGELFYLGKVVWIKREAEAGELIERCGMVWIVGGEHAGGGPGSLGHGAAPLKYGYVEAVGGGQIEGEGETDDSRAGDGNFGCVHSSIVCGGAERAYSFGSAMKTWVWLAIPALEGSS
jgi:hypothetical protein